LRKRTKKGTDLFLLQCRLSLSDIDGAQSFKLSAYGLSARCPAFEIDVAISPQRTRCPLTGLPFRDGIFTRMLKKHCPAAQQIFPFFVVSTKS
jgi:hypothetical protein